MKRQIQLSALLAAAIIPSATGNLWAQVQIGVSIPHTGPVAPLASESSLGINQAVEDLNVQGGILGRQIKLADYDDRCQASQGAQIAQQLINVEKIAFVIGPLCPSTAQTMLPVFGSRSDSVIDIMLATAPDLTEQGYSNIFRIVPRADRQGPLASAYLQRIKADYNIAILNDETPYAAEVIASLRQAWPTLDIDTKFQGQYSSSQPDFAPLIEQLRALDVKVIFVSGTPRGLGKLAAEARARHYPVLFVASEQAWSPNLSQIAGESASGILFTFFPVPTRNAQTEAVVAKMKAKGWGDPSARALYAYASVQILAQAITNVATFNVPTVKTALREKQFETVIGGVAFDAKGDVKDLNYEFYRSQERTITQLNNRPPPPPPPPPR